MLKIYSSDMSSAIPVQLEDDKVYVKHQYGGYDKLVFELKSNDPAYNEIVEEIRVDTDDNSFIVKNIDEHSDFATISCDLNLYDWYVDVFSSFRMTNSLLSEVLDEILPVGWSVSGAAQFTAHKTVERAEGQEFEHALAIEILDEAAATYGCVYQFDTLNKVLTCIDPESYTPSGDFYSDELNLKNFGFVGNSNGLVTRLYAYGAIDEDGVPLTFSDINDGKPYVENNTYSSRVISAYWSDGRYTNKENLLADAIKKLAEYSMPTRSYKFDALLLGNSVWMYKVVTIIDRRRSIYINHQIVEWNEHPNHTGDTIVLSSVEPSMARTTNQIRNEVSEQVAKGNDEMKGTLNTAIDKATSKIVGNSGGSFKWIFDAQGRPVELVNLGDTLDVSTAQKVWRWNAGGLGHSNNGYNGLYTLALLDDGSVNASAITTGILNANVIKSGIIQALVGNSYWDVESGDMHIENADLILSGVKTWDHTQYTQADVQRILDISLEIIEPTDADFARLDINGDGKILADDASLILRMIEQAKDQKYHWKLYLNPSDRERAIRITQAQQLGDGAISAEEEIICIGAHGVRGGTYKGDVDGNVKAQSLDVRGVTTGTENGLLLAGRAFNGGKAGFIAQGTTLSCDVENPSGWLVCVSTSTGTRHGLWYVYTTGHSANNVYYDTLVTPASGVEFTTGIGSFSIKNAESYNLQYQVSRLY